MLLVADINRGDLAPLLARTSLPVLFQTTPYVRVGGLVEVIEAVVLVVAVLV